MLYITILMLVFLLMFNGTQFKITAIFITISIGFALLSSLFMILYGNGSHTILKFGFIHITTESLVRGLHVSLRTIAISFFGILIALTLSVVMIFYSLMQHLKVKSKVAYAFMAAIRMIPLMISSLIQLRRSLKMRYQMIDAANYRGLKKFKHLILPLLAKMLERHINYQLRWSRKDLDGPRTYYYNVPFSYKDIIFIIVLIAIITMAYYCSITLPITGIDDVRLGGRVNFYP